MIASWSTMTNSLSNKIDHISEILVVRGKSSINIASVDGTIFGIYPWKHWVFTYKSGDMLSTVSIGASSIGVSSNSIGS